MFGSKKTLEEKIGAATKMFKDALVSLSEVKQAAIDSQNENNAQIAILQEDNNRLTTMQASLDDKIAILKKLA